ncbi:MAG: UDP-N-acetylglucosamine diphosphorylase [Clostridia bacterium]|nr:UDP-N-acetylglucosamine diphosphorylase [Clostridia bacterium]MBQ7100826.1 UDP-N-acetylglucosamine diphosphorylase [Clostridia bacterium]
MISNREFILYAEENTRRQIIARHTSNGVDIPCADGVIIADGCEIGAGTVILPNTIILGKTKIGRDCTVGPCSILEGCTVGNNSTVNASQCENSVIGSGVSIGPFSHLRPHTVLADNVRAGNFVEVKNSNIGEKTSISHLSYIGDSDVGQGVNIGCGCATANYDGTKKFRTSIGNRVFVGCHTCMVAPVTLGSGSYTAAGSVITDSVPEGTMAIARSRQIIKRKVRKYNES